MRPQLAVRFRAICVAVALVTATAPFVEAASANPLIGATREQVLEKYGEPKNTIVAGNREVLLFEHDRVTLRDNVVIQVERLPEPVRRPPPPAEPAAPASGAGATPAPGATPENQAPANPAPSTAAPAAGTTTAPAPATPPAEDPNAPLEVKVRSRPASRPSASKAEEPAPAPAPATPAAATATATATPTPTAMAPSPVPATTAAGPAATPPVTIQAAPNATPPAAPTTSDAIKSAEAPPAAKALEETAKSDEATAPAPADKKEKAKKKAAPNRLLDEQEVASEPIFTTSSYLIAFAAIAAGGGFLFWRMRQRTLELEATAVSQTPLSAPTATGGGGGAVFTVELLSKLEWKRFEDLVAAYYSKTGVVASRTKSGPASPVHIKISWKGEPRPFALVQCLAGPAGLVDATRLQDLVTALAAEDIRRGYVVTTGKFNVAARDFAEEKHITLLPGDILIEKINALPDPARNELMSEITTGDYTTPSCPKCEQKMVRNPDDPTQWRCATHPDQIIPVK